LIWGDEPIQRSLGQRFLPPRLDLRRAHTRLSTKGADCRRSRPFPLVGYSIHTSRINIIVHRGPSGRRAPLLHEVHEVGKVARRAGWGAERRDGAMQVYVDGSASRPALRQPPAPHPAFGHLPQQAGSQAGEGIARRRSRCVNAIALWGSGWGVAPDPHESSVRAPLVAPLLPRVPQNGRQSHRHGPPRQP
jgi:hypothetical protein